MPQGRGRAFWENLVREVEAGASQSSVAKRYQVSQSGVGIWCRRLRGEFGRADRAFTIMSGLYADIVAAAQFVFRKEPSSLALFVPLKTAATVRSRTTSSAQQGAGAPAVPVPTPDNGQPVDNGAPR